jgi:hypothetical protein
MCNLLILWHIYLVSSDAHFLACIGGILRRTCRMLNHNLKRPLNSSSMLIYFESRFL